MRLFVLPGKWSTATLKNKSRDVRLISGALLSAYLFTSSRWAGNVLVVECLFVTGVVLVGIATLLRGWSVLYLAGHRNERLITQGPFSICRNPIYLSTVLGFVGIAFGTSTLTFPVVTVVASGLFYLSQIRQEEGRLLKRHGARFKMYRYRTPRLLPKLQLLDEPSEVLVQPHEFRRWNASSIWFIFGLGLVQLIYSLHISNTLPTFFRFY